MADFETTHDALDHTGLTGVGVAAFVGCRVYNSATQNVNNTTDTQLTFNSEDYDTDGFHSTGSNTDRITIPTGETGYYLVHAHTTWSPSATGERIMVIRKNGSDVAGASSSVPVNSGTYGTRQIVSVILFLTAGDYLQVNVYQNSGGTRTAGGTGGDVSTFSAAKIG